MNFSSAERDMMKDSILADPWTLKPTLKPNRKYSYSNCPCNLSFDLKRVALEASASVVGILSHLGETNVFRCSGFVVESIHVDGKFVSTIFTSAAILRPEAHIDAVADNIEISVILFNEITCEGEVYGCDFHYNIGVIKIKTDFPIATTRFRHINDFVSIDPNQRDVKSPKYDPQSYKYNLVPGDTVVALGRYHIEGDGLMVVAGKFSVNKTRLDCQELLRAEFEISRHGIGGPLINCDGEVIGINFFSTYFTPFLPINIASMWWEQFKKNGHCLLPQLGMELSNLYLEEPVYLEILIQTFPNFFEGVVVDEIKPERVSPTYSDALLPRDVIVECDGKSVRSILEFFELIWDKVGQSVHLAVLRPLDGSRWDVEVVVGNVGPNQFNRWPLLQTSKEARVPEWLRRRRQTWSREIKERQARARSNVT